MANQNEGYEIDPQTRINMGLQILTRIIARDYYKKLEEARKSKTQTQDDGNLRSDT